MVETNHPLHINLIVIYQEILGGQKAGNKSVNQ